MGARKLQPLTHEAFRRSQRTVDLDGLSYERLRVAWTDVGEGEPTNSSTAFPLGHFSTTKRFPCSHRNVVSLRPISSVTDTRTNATSSIARF